MIDAISFFNKYFLGVCVPVLLMLLGIFYCVRLKFFHFLHPFKTVKALFIRDSVDGVSPTRAVTLALAGTLGVGNMVGVASAIALGGYGAVFWMWISATLAMVLKYAEIVLGMAHRRYDKDGKPYGAAMYYIKDCFGNGQIGVILSSVFALFCIFNSISMGSMIQVNAAANAMQGAFGVRPIFVGLIFAAIAFFAMKKGSNGILRMTEKLVPIMSIGFIILSLCVIVIRFDLAIEAVKLIFEDAFDFKSSVGGVFGFLFSNSIRYGTMRGILSNEAGCGTAPAAHAVSSCKVPAKQGVWGIFEVFVDTLLLCTLTALVLIIGGGKSVLSGDNYMMMTVDAYSSVLGNIAGGFVSLSVVLFGIATVLCWGFYGIESVKYLFKGKNICNAFILIYSVSVVLGSVLSSKIIWEVADLSIGVMTFINLFILLVMNREVKRETDFYFKNTK